MQKVKDRFGLSYVVLVGDRGMLTMARIGKDLAPANLEWVTALRAPTIRLLAEGGYLQLSLFDEADLVEIAHPDFAGERLVLCRNPTLAAERARRREELLAATEAELQKIKAAVERDRNPCLNHVQPTDPSVPAFTKLTVPTPLQRRALDLLAVSLRLGAA